MKKSIEVTPEWVLSNFPQVIYADGNGIISVDTYYDSNANWIRLALQTLCINFKENVYAEDDVTIIDIEFRLKDLQENCPALYKELKSMDAKNKIYKELNIN
jgi:hypothetical protein